MKKTLLYALLVLSVFVLLFGCRKTVDPTVPSATATPNATQTIIALANGIGVVNCF